MSQPTAYITTPIYYVNDRPHIGHVYTSTVCDVWARFTRFTGADVFFLTGTDEHGQKVEKSAHAKGISPQELADANAAYFQSVMQTFQLTNSDFIRTTQPSHMRQVQKMIAKLIEKDAAYLGRFEGWYDEGQEEYYTETKARDLKYKSPVTGRDLVRATEENYYFRLSAFQKTLEDLFAANPDFVRPEARRNEILGRLREGLQDVPISRTNFTWGVPVPGAENHVVYVWIDALMNYITALGLGEPGSETHRARAKYWPATYHVIGKEILWFHAVIWPAILTALELPLPRCIYAHSFWISEGQKMSKSLGNFIDLETINRYLEAYGLDAWRYYLVTQGPLGATDANFAASHFHDIYHTDLVNTVGNCASRVTAMMGKYFDGVVPADTGTVIADHNWPVIAREAVEKACAATERLALQDAAAAALALVRRVDGFINTTEPFKLAKDESRRTELASILYQCAEAVRIASLLLWPILPSRMEDFWRAIGHRIEPNRGGLRELAAWGGLAAGTKVEKVALFPRVEAAMTTTGP
ncbi:MAG TPA: methionine--tRNA ligase [Phycisphaerales bacterium]|nr:methionine--tRNA ligase [Phycisphaerales bacterium]HRQ75714.1 methionine--tRNA ligase [Phycisphaerales bacterium]